MDVKSCDTSLKCSQVNCLTRSSRKEGITDIQESLIWNPFERYKVKFEQGQKYVSLPRNRSDRLVASPLDSDQSLLTPSLKHHPEQPYNQHSDCRIIPSLFRADMPAVHSRDAIIASESAWGEFILVFEQRKMKRYWQSEASKDQIIREEVREMVAILGNLICKMAILIPMA